jgi:N-acetylglucosaminyldiphosphoundecaprenol N-acetyl-beta-D-mannosaminyltransferase
MHRQVKILGANIDRVTLDEAVQVINDFIASGQPHQVATVNLDFIRIAQENAEFRDIINRSELAVADGMPLVWASRWSGDPLPERVTGVELAEQCCALAARNGYRIFLLGGAPGVADGAAEVWTKRYPGLQIVGTYSPPMGPFSAEENQKMVSLVRAAQPHMLFVAFGAPKQDLWIAEHQQQLQVPLAMGVGGVFNFATGRVRRAPIWMRENGLEWLYRVAQEPRRLWRRYFVEDMPIMLQIAADVARVRTVGPAQRATSNLGIRRPELPAATVRPVVPHLSIDQPQ